MKSNRYTLDRFEGDYAIFLKRPKETEQLLIARAELDPTISEGAIVKIEDNGLSYKVEKLDNATAESEKSISSLLAKLQGKNK